MKTLKLFFVACILLAANACNNSSIPKDSVDSASKQNQSKDSAVYGTGNMDSMAPDENFMVKAYSGGMLEIMLGKIATTNAATASVKQFGKMMMTDHTKADSEMAVIAKLKNITLPSAPGNDQYNNINKLEKEQGRDFDKDYTSFMIDDHKEDIKDFQKESQNAKDPDIKAFVVKTIPVLQKHLSAIQAINTSLKK